MDLAGRIINNRYRVQKTIADSPMSSVLLAADSSHGDRPVILKFLKTSVISGRPEDVIRFRAEVARLAALGHENVLGVYESGEFLERLFVAREYIDGRALSRLMDEGDIEYDRALSVILQAAQGLEFLHRHRIVHRDLKPQNIMVTADGVVKIVDAGFAHVKEFSGWATPEDIISAFGYIAPEQCGFLRREVDERSDLYALGVIAYELVTGTLPFRGQDVCSIVHQHIAQSPEPPHTVNAAVGPELDAMIMKLLAKDPADRYQSARGFIADLVKVMAGQAGFLLGLDDRSARLNYRTRLVGRDADMKTLRRLADAALERRGGLCLLRGAAGTGKTRLLEELGDHCSTRGRPIIGGKCFESEGRLPYGPFRDALAAYLGQFAQYGSARREEVREGLREAVGPLGRIIVTLNPAMEALLGETEPLRALEPDREGKRFLMAVASFFKALAVLEKGLVIYIDDCHWADEGTMAIIAEIAGDIALHPLLLMLTARDGDRDGHIDGLVAQLRERAIPLSEITCSVFSEELSLRFVAGLLSADQDDAAAIATFIQHRSKGNPFISLEILKQLIEGGVLSHEEGRWRFARDPAGVDVPPSLVEIIAGRIAHLAESDKEVIAGAAVIGREFNLSLLAALTGLDAAQVVAAVDRAVALQILEESVLERGKFLFVHDRIRSVFFESLGADRLREMHGRTAQAIERDPAALHDSRLYDLAYHYLEAGEIDKSIEYCYPAGLMAKSNYAIDTALRFFEKTLELIDEKGAQSSQLWIDCSLELGGLYVMSGKYERAIDIFNLILPRNRGSANEPFLYRYIADAQYRRGDWRSCEEAAVKGLALLGETVPRTRPGLVFYTAREVLVRVAHVVLPRLFVRETENDRASGYRLIVSFYDSLGMSYALNNPVKLLWSNLHVLNLAERRIGPSAELAMSHYAFGGLAMAVPLFRLADRHFDRALAMSRRLGFDWGEAKTVGFMGYRREWEGLYDEAQGFFERCMAHFERLGDIKEYAMALNGLQHTHYYRGDYRTALKVNHRYYGIAERIGDYYAMSAADIYFAQCHREIGDLEEAQAFAARAAATARERQIWFNYCSALNEMGANALDLRDPAAALVHLREARRLHEENAFLRQYIVPLYANLAQALIDEYVQHRHEWTPAQRRRSLGAIGRAARRALSRTAQWRTHQPAALRVMAHYHALRGRGDRAARWFERSIAVAEELGRRFEQALGLYSYGIHRSQAGEDRRSRGLLESAYQKFTDLGARRYAERCAVILGIDSTEGDTTAVQRLLERERSLAIARFSQRIRAITDTEELLEEVVARAVELAGARRGYLFIAGDDGALEIRASRNSLDSKRLEFSRQIVDRAYRSETTVTVVQDRDGRILAGQGGEGDHVVLCVPLKSRYRVIGVCYLDAPTEGDGFGNRIPGLMEEFFGEVSIAVENALLHSRMSPVRADRDGITAGTEEKVKKAIAFIEENYLSDISREGLAAHLGINPDHLGKAFKIYTGEKISEYINKLRILDAARRLRDDDVKIIDIAFAVGFESLSTFNRAFLKEMGVTPKEYRKRAE